MPRRRCFRVERGMSSGRDRCPPPLADVAPPWPAGRAATCMPVLASGVETAAPPAGFAKAVCGSPRPAWCFGLRFARFLRTPASLGGTPPFRELPTSLLRCSAQQGKRPPRRAGQQNRSWLTQIALLAAIKVALRQTYHWQSTLPSRNWHLQRLVPGPLAKRCCIGAPAQL